MTLYDALQVLDTMMQKLDHETEERLACEIIIDTIDALKDHSPSRTVIESLELYRARRAMHRRDLSRG